MGLGHAIHIEARNERRFALALRERETEGDLIWLAARAPPRPPADGLLRCGRGPISAFIAGEKDSPSVAPRSFVRPFTLSLFPSYRVTCVEPGSFWVQTVRPRRPRALDSLTLEVTRFIEIHHNCACYNFYEDTTTIALLVKTSNVHIME